MTRALERLETGPLSRRGFLHVGVSGIAGLSLAQALRRDALAAAASPSPRARNVIMVFLTGGPATIDMWDMKPAAPQRVRGEFAPAATSVPGVQICQHLPKLAQALKHAALVRSLTHTVAEHTQGVAYLMTGNSPSPAVEFPSLGSLAACLLEATPGLPTYMALGKQPNAGAGDLGAAFGPLELSLPEANAAKGMPRPAIGLPSGLAATDLERRRTLLDRLDQEFNGPNQQETMKQLGTFGQQAFDILRSDKINQALDTQREPESIRTRYGGATLGRELLAARRLVEAGARFVTVGFGDWDTHANNFERLRGTLLPQLDVALSALLEDLARRGLLSGTIVYCTGEFGRTPLVNGNAGRDHWAHTMTALVAGGGLKAGYVHGATDADAYEPTAAPCSPDDLSATLLGQLGFAPTQTVPGRAGRPLALFRNGQVVEGLVA